MASLFSCSQFVLLDFADLEVQSGSGCTLCLLGYRATVGGFSFLPFIVYELRTVNLKMHITVAQIVLRWQ